MPGDHVEEVFTTLKCGHVLERTVRKGTVGHAVHSKIMCTRCADKQTCTAEVKRA